MSIAVSHFFFSSRRRHTRFDCDWSSDVCSSDLHTPPTVGSLEYRGATGGRMTLATLQGFVRNEGDAWLYTLRSLSQFYEQILTHPSDFADPPTIIRPRFADRTATPEVAEETIGGYLESARLLGQRTAE